ncbi:hypothetical protein B0H16DRAFT_221705 [Mycena metata]|uniref:DUF6534 domain-containing protein n=1 Tax=Mycena metata TaxID=1033252 RepID=A0AAD7MS12_9AGAR|nr:hypothetical protein B0H16DRAFT_221705 [Mycena metata]
MPISVASCQVLALNQEKLYCETSSDCDLRPSPALLSIADVAAESQTETGLSLPTDPTYWPTDPRTPQMPSLPAAVFPFTPVPSLTFESQDLTMGADLFLQGVLCAQFAHYTNVNQRDSMWMKLFVAGLALFTTLKTIQVLAMISVQNVVLFEGPGVTPSSGSRAWLFQMNLIFEAAIAFYVQLFFCHRLWALSHNVYIMVVAMSLFISALVTASVAVCHRYIHPLSTLNAFQAYFSTNRSIASRLIVTHLGLAMGGDLLQTGSIVFYLLRHSQAVLRHGPVASMIGSLLRLSIQSAAPGAFCALVDFAATFHVIRSAAITSGPTLAFVISVIANIMLPKLYAIAAMWTLNSRDEIRSTATRLDFLSFGGVDAADTSPAMPRLRASGIETTTTNSINGIENIEPNSAERKAWEV